MIEELDWSVGQVLKALKDNGLEEKTLVMFASDNGPWLSYGNHGGVAGPLREGKMTTFEGGIRVPFLARYPGLIKPGRVCEEPAMTSDGWIMQATRLGNVTDDAIGNGMAPSFDGTVDTGKKCPKRL